MQTEYLEIVTPNIDSQCELYSAMHGVTFSDPEAKLGGARTAQLANGGMIGIRAPLHEAEKPVVRPYILVADIEAAVASAEAAGALIALPPMEIPGYGRCAIIIEGGIESGLWEN